MKRFYLLALMVASLFYVACGDSDEVDNIEPTPNPPTPPAEVKVDTPQNVSAMDGHERVKICWKVNTSSEVKVTKTLLYYGADNSYKEYPVTSDGECEAVIDKLEEGEHTFQLANRDNDGNESAKVTISAKAYGEEYISELESRPIVDWEYVKKEQKLIITWQKDWDKGLGTEVYLPNEDSEGTWIENDENVTEIEGVEEGVDLEIRTSYQPDNCFDILYAEPYTITPVADIIPVADPTDVKSMDGYKRVKIMWSNDPESTVVKTVIYWDERESHEEVAVSPDGMQEREIIIDELAEGDYTFEVVNYDEDGQQSNAVSVTAKAYGEEYVASLTTRTLNDLAYDKHTKCATIEWTEWSNGIGTEVSYIPSEANEPTTINVANSDLTTEITPIDEGTDINIQTLYQPENCMDVMRSKIVTINPEAEVIPVADPAEVKSMDGYERVKLMWSINVESTVTKTTIYWNEKKSYKEVEFKPTAESGSQQCEIIIEDLEEGDYTFEVVNFDAEGAQSDAVGVTAKAYGEKYVATLQTRGITSESYDKKTKTETIEWDSWDKGVNTELSYKASGANSATTIVVEHSDKTTEISPIDEGEVITFQTVYQPENCMDAMRATTLYLTTKAAVVEVAEPTDLSATDGKERVKLMWKIDGQSTVAKSIVYWNNRRDSREQQFSKSGQSGLQQCEMMIENLAESNYTFEIVNYDAEGNSSAAKSISARAYGAQYISQLATRSVIDIEHDDNAKVATLTLESWNKGDKSIIEYPHATTGSTVSVEVTNSASTVTLNNIAAEQEFTIYTLYTPNNCMDQMQSAKQSYTTPEAPPQVTTYTVDIKVMQFNVKYGDIGGIPILAPYGPWSGRKANVAAFINSQAPDFVGLQELGYGSGDSDYYTYILNNMGSNYAGIKYERNSSDREGNAIIYRKDKFELVSSGRYWLHNPVEECGKFTTSDGKYTAKYERIVVWGIFKEKSSEQEFYVTTTHLDNSNTEKDKISGDWRTFPVIWEQGQTLINHTNARANYGSTDNDGRRPIIVTGDMNCNYNEAPMTNFTSKGYKDTWDAAQNRSCPDASCPRSTMSEAKSSAAQKPYSCFDYIYVSGDILPTVVQHTIHQPKYNGTHLSDHNAVSAVLRYEITK